MVDIQLDLFEPVVVDVTHEHVWSSWSYERIELGPANVEKHILQRRCFSCTATEEMP